MGLSVERAALPPLADTAALVVGAGGLGCPVALALAEAGVGRLVLLDPDVVELSNLQRQVLYTEADLGRPKARVAQEVLEGRFGTRVDVIEGRLDAGNADALMGPVGVAIDASDDPACGFLLSDAAFRLRTPAVLGGVVRFEGLVMGVDGVEGPCWRCLFEDVPEPCETESCAAAGVLGAMAGVVGHLQAERALALLGHGAGVCLSATGYVSTVDGLRGRVRHVDVPATPDCPACGASPDEESAVIVHLPPALRPYAGGRARLRVPGASVGEVLAGLTSRCPELGPRLLGPGGAIMPHVGIYADREDVRFTGALATPLRAGSELQILHALGGR